eukprot:6209011-Pleurochrysis_carterae.AAC.2
MHARTDILSRGTRRITGKGGSSASKVAAFVVERRARRCNSKHELTVVEARAGRRRERERARLKRMPRWGSGPINRVGWGGTHGEGRTLLSSARQMSPTTPTATAQTWYSSELLRPRLRNGRKCGMYFSKPASTAAERAGGERGAGRRGGADVRETKHAKA